MRKVEELVSESLQFGRGEAKQEKEFYKSAHAECWKIRKNIRLHELQSYRKASINLRVN